MRTTLEMKPEHRARLLAIAARRGAKGFSAVVEEAIEAYLRDEEQRNKIRKAALRTGGSLTPKEAGRLRRRTEETRAHWR